MIEVLVIVLTIVIVIVFIFMSFADLKKSKQNQDIEMMEAGYQVATDIVDQNFNTELQEIDDITIEENPEDELAARINRRKGPL
tara:strand:+ start:2652 stop:2903 length:252 start_codon:yes stop_codon:yes gene_type:complete